MTERIKNALLVVMAGVIIILAGLLALTEVQRRLAVVGKQVAEARVSGMVTDLNRQKAQATRDLKAANASILAQQKRLDAFHAQQEKTDAANSSRVAERRSDLVRYRAGARLLARAEDARRGSGGAAQQGGDAASADGGAASGASGTGLFSRAAAEAREDEGDADAHTADRINVAYASCRADAFNVRQTADAITLSDGTTFSGIAEAG